ncbi:UDP-4-amino-4,6-dideoxy-N-acetyl-beta-L-altrosamine N-acetyltransferase [Caulobacter sp. S45]|uniref:UDP-4-amino-4, 6-dideoxy-N-acetyl-beta-L-altrosamine N-acetyltransferase n=1 Tax=Caulobacter sp. S45 TaxID=1641861 RepID=UPI0015753922|nr:UDP-4-amino-4,6-dideoxy-N-acetyl-beta-L-altrosamine N-acetyltransferase [Caulobacter sp. S45]
MSVRLRRLAQADGPRVLAWRNSPEVAAHMYSDHVIGEQEHALWLQAALTRPDRAYWIIELDGAPVGLANLVRIELEANRADLAIYLADPAVRGRGVGAAAEYLVLGHAFETRGLDKLWVEVLARNVPGWRLHESFGFTREALFRDHVRKGGVFQEVVGLGLLRREWPKAKALAEGRLARSWALPSLFLEA